MLPPSANQRSIVFVVDSDALERDRITWTLSAAGYVVEAFPSVQEFLSAPWPKQPSVALVEILSPDVAGVEEFREVLAAGCCGAVVATSPRFDIPTVAQVLKIGAVDVLQKPFDPSGLLAVVHEANALAWARFKCLANFEMLLKRARTAWPYR